MKKLIFALIIATMLAAQSVMALSVRIKDIAGLDGIFDAKLIGIGLVTGLNNTGDKKNAITQRFLENVMENMGVSLELDGVDMQNVAVVTVSATLPPFAKIGSKIDVQIDSFQSAVSLQGGTLLPTPMFHALDEKKEIHLMASGVISIGGFGAGAGGDKVQKNHLTAGYIPNGGTVHKAMRLDVFENEELILVPYHADYTTVTRMTSTINGKFGDGVAMAIDSGSILIKVPENYQSDELEKYTDRVVKFVAEIGELRVEVDRPATVIIDERTGTIVVGSNVTISTVAVTHGSLVLTIGTELEFSQPAPLSEGETVIGETASVEFEEREGALVELSESSNVGEVVSALNALGATPRELISILHNIERAGALHAKLEIR